MIKSETRRILDLVAYLSQNNVMEDVLETEIISLPIMSVRMLRIDTQLSRLDSASRSSKLPADPQDHWRPRH